MIIAIAFKELYTNLTSARFTIGFLLCLFLIPFTMIVSINDFKGQLNAYEMEKKQADENNKAVKVYSALRPEIVKPPVPLSIFSRGISYNVGNKVKILFGDKTLLAEGRGSVSSNPLMNAFFSLDFISIIAIIMSLLALLFTYDACSGEREYGTLKLMLSNSVSRSVVLLGKAIGVVMTVSPIIFFCFALSALIILFHPAVSFSGGEWVRIGIMFLMSMVYFMLFMAIGLLVSSRLRSSVTSIVICLFLWIAALFVIPNMAIYAGQSFIEKGSLENVNFVSSDLDKELYEKGFEHSKTIDQPDWWMNWIYSGGIDGRRIVGGSSKGLYEHYRQSHEYTEPLRIEYADKKWILQKEYLDKLDKQRLLAERLALLSPSEIFRQSVSTLCGTDVSSHYRFIERTRQYRETLIQYFRDKKLFSSFAYFTHEDPKTFKTADEIVRIRTGGQFSTLAEYSEASGSFDALGKVEIPNTNPHEAEPLDQSDVPKFQWKSSEVMDDLKNTIGKLGAMIIAGLILFFLSFASFTRYDVR